MKSGTQTERAFRRRLALLALLHQRPYRYDEIIASLDQDDLFIYDREVETSAIAALQRHQFRNDLRALRHSDYRIAFDRASKCYTWSNSPFGLSLNQTQLTTFALLLDTFTNSTLLHAADIQAFLALLLDRLPAEQQKFVNNHRRSFSIDLHETTDYRTADPNTIKHVEMAIQRTQQLEFSYRTPRDGKERRHVIEPRPLVFEHGHVYLYGWSLEWEKELRFRLDYIISGSARMLPISGARPRPAPPAHVLRYHLDAVIARNSVSQHFPQQRVEMHPDGSATVTATITDLFAARRILLSYGENCTVLEPPELVEQMRIVAAAFHKKYPPPRL